MLQSPELIKCHYCYFPEIVFINYVVGEMQSTLLLCNFRVSVLAASLLSRWALNLKIGEQTRELKKELVGAVRHSAVCLTGAGLSCRE